LQQKTIPASKLPKEAIPHGTASYLFYYGFDYNTGDMYCAWIVWNNSRSSYTEMTYANAVRPVIYLTTEVQLVSGTGTSGDPFILE